MNWYKAGALMWTASGAGWAVLAWLMDDVGMAVIAVCCLVAASVWNEWLSR